MEFSFTSSYDLSRVVQILGFQEATDFERLRPECQRRSQEEQQQTETLA